MTTPADNVDASIGSI